MKRYNRPRRPKAQFLRNVGGGHRVAAAGRPPFRPRHRDVMARMKAKRRARERRRAR